jgi:branched-chain amino acid transport system substrate-binding protein
MMNTKMKKSWIGIGALVLVTLAIVFFVTQTKKEPKVVRIGVILPLTGELASHAEDAKKGIELAVQIKNKFGGINGAKLVPIYEDDRANPTAGVSAFQKLVASDKVQVVLGGFTSSVALAIAPIAERNKVVLFSPTASHPNLTKVGGYVFRNWPSDDYDAKVVAEFSYRTLHKTTFAIVHPNNDNGRALSELFEVYIKKLGGRVVLNEGYDLGTTDFRVILGKVKSYNPDALYLPGYYEDVARLLVQAVEMGLKTQVLCSSAVESPKFIELARNAAEGVIYSKTSVNFEDENYKNFVRDFESAYSVAPGIAASQSFDAINILSIAIERGGYSGENIREELLKVKDFPGVTGATSFDAKGDVIKTFTIFTIADGKFTQYKLSQ